MTSERQSVDATADGGESLKSTALATGGITYRKLLIVLCLLAVVSFAAAVIVDYYTNETLVSYPVTANWIGTLLSIPLPILAAVLIFDRWQKEAERRHVRQLERESRLDWLIPRLAQVRGHIEQFPLFSLVEENGDITRTLTSIQQHFNTNPLKPLRLDSSAVYTEGLRQLNQFDGTWQEVLSLRLEEFEAALLKVDVFGQDPLVTGSIKEVGGRIASLRYALPNPSWYDMLTNVNNYLKKADGEWDRNWVKHGRGGFRLELSTIVALVEALQNTAIEAHALLASSDRLQEALRGTIRP